MSVYTLFKQGCSTLIYAVFSKNIELCSLLLQYYYDVDYQATNYMSAMHIAASSGDIYMIELLYKHNATIDLFDIRYFTPLHRAIKTNQYEAVKLLLTIGASPLSQTDKVYYFIN